MGWAVASTKTGEIRYVSQGARKPEKLPESMLAIETEMTADELRECTVVDGEIVPKKTEKVEAELNARAWESLRSERGNLLRAHVDTMNPLRWETMTEAQRQAWRDYRQALLDLPETTKDPRNPIWPARPE